MNNRLVIAALAASLLGMSACSKPAPQSDIGLVDVPRITANWPKFLNYQNQLNSDVAAIQRSSVPDNVKQRQLAGLQAQFQQNQIELTTDVKSAAQQVAGQKNLKFVLTRQFVGYGGVDITPDVEKILDITEKATPSP